MGLFNGSILGGLIGNILFDSDIIKQEDPTKGPAARIMNEIAKEVIKSSDTLAGELVRTIDDSVDELNELLTDGFVEMVIKGNEDYKTSYEKRNIADGKIADAREKYEKCCLQFNKYLEQLNDQINDLYEQKVMLAEKFDKTINEISDLPRYEREIYTPTYTYKKSTINLLCSCTGILNTSDIKGKKDSANAYLEDARDFEVYVDRKIAEINKTQAFLDSVKMNLEEEQQLINVLNDSLNKNRKLKYMDIERQLHTLIAEYILDSNGEKNKKYVEAVEALKKIC